MIAVVPVLLLAPPMLVFIPPLMMFAPAAFPCLMQFPPLVLGFPAVSAVVFNRFVQFMLGTRNPTLALFLCFRVQAR